MSEGTERPSKWIPMSGLIDIAHLGKLSEETGELIAIINRCLIQGLNGVDPETGKPNILALQEEIADVRAMSNLVVRRFGFDETYTAARTLRKEQMKMAWYDMIIAEDEFMSSARRELDTLQEIEDDYT